MSNPLKLGKLHSICKPSKCVICGRDTLKSSDYAYIWICKDCSNSVLFKENSEVWFLKYNKDLDKLEVHNGIIKGYHPFRDNTYHISYINPEGIHRDTQSYKDYVFKDKQECIDYGNSIGQVISEEELNDITTMKKQDVVYKQIENFLKSKEAISSNIIGINVIVEDGYVNASWKFGNREENDIKE